MREPASLPPSARRPSRFWLYAPFAMLGVVLVAWSALWFYAQTQVAAAIDGLIANEGARGRSWACGQRSIAGFPFRMEVSCADPTFAGVVPGQYGVETKVTGSLKALKVYAQVYDPNHVIADLTGPLLVTQSSRPGARVDWQLARASLIGRSMALSEVSFMADGLAVAVENTPEAAFKAQRVEAHLRQAAGEPPGTFDVVAKLRDAKTPLLDAAAGSADPVQLELQARADKVVITEGKPAPVLLEEWRLAGGTLKLVVATVEKGPLRFDGKGTLSLDDAHRPQGQVDMSIAGAEKIMAQFGVNIGNVGGLLGGLLGGGKTGAAKGINLPLRMERGKAYVGPFPLPRPLPPLY